MSTQNRNRFTDTHTHTHTEQADGCQKGVGLGDWVQEVEGLGSIDGQL